MLLFFNIFVLFWFILFLYFTYGFFVLKQSDNHQLKSRLEEMEKKMDEYTKALSDKEVSSFLCPLISFSLVPFASLSFSFDLSFITNYFRTERCKLSQDHACVTREKHG